MHRCLAIPEILYAVCEVVRDKLPGFSGSKGTLAALARTCRTFQEPALNNLWYELEDLCPLIRSLPREAWTSSDAGSGRGLLLVSVSIMIGEIEAVNTTIINLMVSLLSPPILRSLHILVERERESHRVSVPFPPIPTTCDWSALRTLSLLSPTVEDVVRIGNLPNLQAFTLISQVSNQYQIESSVLGSFTSLRALGIEGHPQMLARWLPSFRNAKIVTLSIYSSTDSECSDGQWRELFTNLGKNVDHSSLRKLRIIYPKISVPTLQASDMLPPLLCFTELRSFSIHLKRSLPLSNRETLELTKSWSKVTKIEFTPNSFEPEYCSKLSSLVLWAKHCPKLEHLYLSVDASDRDDRLDLLSRLITPEFDAAHSSLTALNIGRSPITHKEFVALFLLRIFPNLKHIVNYKEKRRRWAKVIFLMSLMKASRNTSRETIEAVSSRNLRYWWADRSSNRTHSDEESDG